MFLTGFVNIEEFFEFTDINGPIESLVLDRSGSCRNCLPESSFEFGSGGPLLEDLEVLFEEKIDDSFSENVRLKYTEVSMLILIGKEIRFGVFGA